MPRKNRRATNSPVNASKANTLQQQMRANTIPRVAIIDAAMLQPAGLFQPPRSEGSKILVRAESKGPWEENTDTRTSRKRETRSRPVVHE